MSDLKIKVHKTSNFTDAQIQHYMEAVADTEKVLNSKRFKEKLLKLKLTSTEGLTNLQIHQKMMKGAEDLEPVEDKEVDVFITMYYKNNRVVGYTYPSTRDTWVNSKFFNQYEKPDVGRNLVHEWLHKLGFGHSSASEQTSVPYAVGDLAGECMEEMYKHPELYADVLVEEPKEEPKEPTPVEPPKEEPKPEPKPEPAPEKKLICKRLWYTLWTKKVCWYE